MCDKAKCQIWGRARDQAGWWAWAMEWAIDVGTRVS